MTQSTTPTPGAAGRVVLIANQTIGGEDLQDAVVSRIGTGRTTFHLLVPVANYFSRAIASPAAIESGIPMVATDQVDHERELGEQRLEAGLAWLDELGATATGEVILSGDTVERVRGLVDAGDIVEVVVSTLPSRLSKWLHQDLPHRVERKVDVPVAVVTPAD